MAKSQPADGHSFSCAAAVRNTSNNIMTINPKGYGKIPTKKAINVAISAIINSAEIQSNLIRISVKGRYADNGRRWFTLPGAYPNLEIEFEA